MTEFKVGDKVKSTKGDHSGQKGTIRGISGYTNPSSGKQVIHIQVAWQDGARAHGPADAVVSSYGMIKIEPKSKEDWADIWEEGAK